MSKIIYLLLILMLIPVANAETGTLTIETSAGNSYTAEASAVSAGVFDYTKFGFDVADYNYISKIQILNARGTFSIDAASSPFTISAGGTGTGTISFDKSTKTITWFFNNAHITSSPVTLTYTTDILSAYLSQTNTCVQTGASVSATQPVKFFGTTSAAMASQSDNIGFCGSTQTFIVQSQTSFSNNYNVAYNNGVANVSIDKSISSVSSKIEIRNSTARKFIEGSINTVSFSYAFQYDTGLILNMSDSVGDYDSVIVNSTGIPPTPGQAGTNQTTITKPSTGVNIAFDKTSYFVGDNVNISYWFSDTEWDALGAKYMNIYLNDALQEDISGAFKHGLNSQSGFYIYSATASGTLKAEVVREILFISKNTWDESIEILPPGNSWIALSNSTSYAKRPVNVTYHIGYSVSTYPPAAIEIQTIDAATGIKVDNVFPDTFPGGVIPIGVIHPFPPGNYSVRLYDVVKDQVLDIKTLQVVLQPSEIPVLGIATSSISTDKGIYFYNDYMQATFQVDDVNFSNYSIRGEIFDVNNSLVTKRIYSPFTDQVGTYTTIVNIDKKQKCENGLNCWFNIGNNTIYMVAYNSTNSLNIAHANFTVSSTTSDGYGLQVSTITPSANVPFQVTTIVPSLHTGVLVVANDGYKKIVYAVNQTVASGTNTIPVTITPVNNNGVAYYVAELYGDDGYLKVKIPLTVSQPVVTTTTATASGTAIQLTSFLSSNIFWALVFIIGFMLAIAVYERKGK